MHALVTSAISFDSSRCDAVDAQLQKINNPAAKFLADELDALGTVHFMSITVVRPTQGPPLASSKGPAHLIVELNADGAEASAIGGVCDAVGDTLSALLSTAGIQFPQSGLADFLLARRVRVGQGWLSTPGLVFDGTPGMTVERIRREADLAAYATDLLKRPTRVQNALARLGEVRYVLWSEGNWKWAFVAEPAPILSAGPSIAGPAVSTPVQLLSGLYVLPKVVFSLFVNFLWPFLLLPLALFVLIVCYLEHSILESWWVLGWSLSGILWGSAAVVFGLLAGFAVFVFGLTAELVPAFWGLYKRLRRLEKTDRPDDIAPDPGLVAEIMKRENFAAQNHLAAVSAMKTGRLRKVTLRFGLWAAGQIAQHFSRPGFLATTGEIHFARWILLPGTDKLLFFSNYDGGWESYLEDFIERSSQGVSGIWSNTNGFPKTESLFFGGASDGDRLRRWTRRQQHPTLFWYSGYPSLTQDRIRTQRSDPARTGKRQIGSRRRGLALLLRLRSQASGQSRNRPEFPLWCSAGCDVCPMRGASWSHSRTGPKTTGPGYDASSGRSATAIATSKVATMSKQSTASTHWLSGSHTLGLRSSGAKRRSQRFRRPSSMAVLHHGGRGRLAT